MKKAALHIRYHVWHSGLVQESLALLLFPLLGHLFLQVAQLVRQVLYELVGGIQLRRQRAKLVLFPVILLRCQRHGSHTWEPVQILLLGKQRKETLYPKVLCAIIDFLYSVLLVEMIEIMQICMINNFSSYIRQTLLGQL